MRRIGIEIDDILTLVMYANGNDRQPLETGMLFSYLYDLAGDVTDSEIEDYADNSTDVVEVREYVVETLTEWKDYYSSM